MPSNYAHSSKCLPFDGLALRPLFEGAFRSSALAPPGLRPIARVRRCDMLSMVLRVASSLESMQVQRQSLIEEVCVVMHQEGEVCSC